MTTTTQTLPAQQTDWSRLTRGRLIALSVGPGLASLLGYIISAAVYRNLGLPNIFALYTAILLVEVPLLTYLIVHFTRREHGTFSWRLAVPWQERLPWWQYLAFGLPLIVFSMIIQGAIGPALGETIRAALFAWVPDWLALSFSPDMMMTLSRPALIGLWVLGLVSAATIGGLMQEVYFRGYLLPRMAHMGKAAPAYNALLFALYHLTSPWSWPAFFVMFIPWAYAVYWKKSVALGIIAHSGMLLISWLMMTAMIFAGS